MSTNTLTKRRTELDVLRVIACCMVIGIHASAGVLVKFPATSRIWQVTSVYNAFCRAAVALFVMISGVNFLQREQPMRVIFRKYILRLLVIIVVWRLLYAVDYLLSYQEWTFASLLTWQGWCDLGYYWINAGYQLYFLSFTITAYLLLPALWAIAHYREGKYVTFLCVLFVGMQAAVSVLSVLPIPASVSAFLSFFIRVNFTFPSYMLLGYALYRPKQKRWSSKMLLLAFFAVVGVTAAVNIWITVSKGDGRLLLLDNTAISSVLEAMLLLALLRNLSESRFFARFARFFAWLSRCTLGIFLLHVLVLEHIIRRFGLSPVGIPTWLYVPLLSGAVFIICLGATALLRKIPIVNKWLV